ncbi:MAG TPA: hypothetical protein VIQ00_11660 [Chitinophagaceae bacterium]
MKIFGILLIIAGILLMVFRTAIVTQKEKIIDLGGIEVNKKEKQEVEWPLYAGAIVTIAGIVVLVSGNKRR